jgi:hypothetical protein
MFLLKNVSMLVLPVLKGVVCGMHTWIDGLHVGHLQVMSKAWTHILLPQWSSLRQRCVITPLGLLTIV